MRKQAAPAHHLAHVALQRDSSHQSQTKERHAGRSHEPSRARWSWLLICESYDQSTTERKGARRKEKRNDWETKLAVEPSRTIEHEQ